MTLRPLIIKFDIFENGECFKAVTNQYVDLVVYGATHDELVASIPEALKVALEGKFSKKIANIAEVIESDTPQTYIANFPTHLCAAAL